MLWFNWRDIRNPESGGAEVFTHEIAKRFAIKGNEVTLFTSEFSGCKKDEIIDDIRIVRAGGKYSVFRTAREFYVDYFSKQRFTIVIDECNTRPFLVPKFVNSGEKIIFLIHQLAREFWFYETPFPMNFLGYYFLENRWLRNYVDIPTITVSESTKKDLLNLRFRKVFTVYNGVNVKPLKEVPEKNANPAIIYVGRMKRAKKTGDVIIAFEMVRREIRDAELWMVGDGYLRRRLEKKACEGITFFGYVDQKKKIELMERAWLIVVPGIREGWGQVVTDANALGTPAVAYDVPGLRDSVNNGYNGLLIDGNIETLANAMITILTDDKQREEFSRNAIEWASRFSWDESAEVFEKIVREILSE